MISFPSLCLRCSKRLMDELHQPGCSALSFCPYLMEILEKDCPMRGSLGTLVCSIFDLGLGEGLISDLEPSRCNAYQAS